MKQKRRAWPGSSFLTYSNYNGERKMNESIVENDIRQIEAVMKTYVEGGRTGSVETLRPIFHELATICGYVGPDLFAQPIEQF